jgi:hypothetical protein
MLAGARHEWSTWLNYRRLRESDVFGGAPGKRGSVRRATRAQQFANLREIDRFGDIIKEQYAKRAAQELGICCHRTLAN